MSRVNHLKLSPHFWLSEFEEPGTHLVMVHPVLIDALEAIHVRFDQPIHVTSGYRGAQHNAASGGAVHSLHLRGAAADLVVPARQMDSLEHFARLDDRLLVIRETDHLHVEVTRELV